MLRGRQPHAVAAAAQIVGQSGIDGLIPDLVAAFDRLTDCPAKADPGCRAKTEIAEALYRLRYDDEEVFLRGIHHVQMEPVWGGEVDTAADLRGACAVGLVRMDYPYVLVELADLLADAEQPARIAAIRAVAYSGNEVGVPLLRFKALVGGDDPQVMGECFAALLKLAPGSSLAFVGRFLDAPERALRETAALAIGESRLSQAVGVLREWWERTVDAELRRTALLAIAMLRHGESIEFLLSLVRDAPLSAARDAIAALGLYRHDDVVRERVLNVARERDDVDLSGTFAEALWEEG